MKQLSPIAVVPSYPQMEVRPVADIIKMAEKEGVQKIVNNTTTPSPLEGEGRGEGL